jgi:hypothetical protein
MWKRFLFECQYSGVIVIPHGDVHVANEQFKGIENIDFLVGIKHFITYILFCNICMKLHAEMQIHIDNRYLFWTNWYFLISSSKF